MDMMKIQEKLHNFRIIPVIKIDDADKAVDLARALVDGGLPCMEITFRTDEAKQAIENIIVGMPDVLVGAGTVLSPDQVDGAIDAGAKFIVTPGFNPRVVSYCIEREIPVFPGCATPSDFEKALEMGLTTVKLFPAEPLGGINYLKTVSAPYPMLKFIPTGGISEKNFCDYLSSDRVIACGGSWITKDDLVNNDKFEEITLMTRSALKKAGLA